MNTLSGEKILALYRLRGDGDWDFIMAAIDSPEGYAVIEVVAKMLGIQGETVKELTFGGTSELVDVWDGD